MFVARDRGWSMLITRFGGACVFIARDGGWSMLVNLDIIFIESLWVQNMLPYQFVEFSNQI